nr:putative carbohydrate binding domain containing protein [uncultured Mediterranean phage uvMED]
MATVNLGSIRFNWKGAYNNSTAYVVNDVVTSSGNSYVCIQASQGNAVGNATAYWNIMSSAGTNGTNGTDLTSTLTTRGDIVYKGASALTRLPKGSTGQVLKQGANDPEWGTVSSDFVKLYDYDGTGQSAVTTFNVDGYFNDALYRHYKVIVSDVYAPANSNSSEFLIRFNVGGSPVTSSNYRWSLDEAHRQGHHNRGSQNDTSISQSQGTWSARGDNVSLQALDMMFFSPTSTGTGAKQMTWNGIWHQNNGGGYHGATMGSGQLNTTSALTGFNFSMANSHTFTYKISIYGYKK